MIQGGINGKNRTVVMIICMAYKRTRAAFMIPATARISGAVNTSSDAVDDLLKLIISIVGPLRRIHTSGGISSTSISTIEQQQLLLMMLMLMMMITMAVTMMMMMMMISGIRCTTIKMIMRMMMMMMMMIRGRRRTDHQLLITGGGGGGCRRPLSIRRTMIRDAAQHQL
jgi:hypothetical protein